MKTKTRYRLREALAPVERLLRDVKVQEVQLVEIRLGNNTGLRSVQVHYCHLAGDARTAAVQPVELAVRQTQPQTSMDAETRMTYI